MNARDEVFALLWAAWQASTPALNGGKVAPMLWQGQEDQAPPDGAASYGSAFFIHNTSGSGQSTLSGASGTIRWRRTGILTVQCRAPTADGQGLLKAESLAKIVRDAFQGTKTPGGVWFRNPRIVEVGPVEGGRYQVNALVDAEYDEVA